MQTSSKTNQKEKKTGRFGTGFITTYLLSKQIEISGIVIKDEENRSFKFSLDREANDPEEFYRKQLNADKLFYESVEEDNQEFEGDYKTKFTYYIKTGNDKTVNNGLNNIELLLPITLAFNKEIRSIEIINYGKKQKYDKFKVSSQENISQYKILVSKDNEKVYEKHIYVFDEENFSFCTFTERENDCDYLLPMPMCYPRLFLCFPLIGTENIGLPIIINSKKFDPHPERNAIYLTEDSITYEDNKLILEMALENLPQFAEHLMKKSVHNLWNLVVFDSSTDDWINQVWFKDIKKKVLNKMIDLPILSLENSTSEFYRLADINIPYASTLVLTNGLCKLLSNTKDSIVPDCQNIDNWISLIKGIANLSLESKDPSELSYVNTIDKIIDKYIINLNSTDELGKILTVNVFDWLNGIYDILLKEKGHSNIEKYSKLLPNKLGFFCNSKNISLDGIKDEIIINLSSEINLNFAERLLNDKISVLDAILKRFELNEAEKEILVTLNEVAETDNQYIEQNAKFLKWITENGMNLITELKIFTQDIDKDLPSKFKFVHLSKGDKLLPPKEYLKEDGYIYYSEIVNNKHCMNNIYVKHLPNSAYDNLAKDEYIYINPLEVKRINLKESSNMELLKLLVLDDNDINYLKRDDDKEEIVYDKEIEYSDFLYLTSSTDCIYSNITKGRCISIFNFLFFEAVIKDTCFNENEQSIIISHKEEDKKLILKRCLWASRAFEGVKWVIYKTSIGEENPNVTNLSELLKNQSNKEEILEKLNSDKPKKLLELFKIDYFDIWKYTLPEEEREPFNNATSAVIKLLKQGMNSSEVINAVKEVIKERTKKGVFDRQLKRNQEIGEKFEQLFKELMSKEEYSKIEIERHPWGQDYILVENVDLEELINDNNYWVTINIKNIEDNKVKWYIELKTTSRNVVLMSKLQVETAVSNKNNYALIIIHVDKDVDKDTLDNEFIITNAKVISDIGFKTENKLHEYENLKNEKDKVVNSNDDIQVEISDEQPKFIINSSLWEKHALSLSEFFKKHFY
jgi:hypothetical protein